MTARHSQLNKLKIDKNKFIDSGVKYIYALDQYPRARVVMQIADEFDEIMALNDPDILQKRQSYFGVGQPEDYLNRVIETVEGDVIAAIRHMGGDKSKPFVFVWPSFKITSIGNILSAVSPHFEIFNPEYLNYYSRPDCNNNKPIVQQRYIARIAEMPKSDSALTKPEEYYAWYESEYAQFHEENPEYVNRISVNNRELMDKCLNQNLLFVLEEEGEKIGLVAAENEIFLGKRAIHLNEILIAKRYRAKGYARKLLASFIGKLDAEYFTCEIDSDNRPSVKTSLQSGQKVFSQEILLQYKMNCRNTWRHLWCQRCALVFIYKGINTYAKF